MPATRRPKKRQTEPRWLNPREPIPQSTLPRPILDRALAALAVDGDIPDIKITPEIVAAVIHAQALRDLGARIIEAASISRIGYGR